MSGDAAAFAALGLGPDADADDIDRAYRALIKLYHPDREGGDAVRAAEINRAYRELRGRPFAADPLIVAEDHDRARGGKGWVVAAAALAVILGALLLATGPVTAWMRDLSPTPVRLALGRPAAAARADPLDQPIDRGAIEGAARDARRLSSSRGEAALSSASGECDRALRLRPSVARLDRCAAFDDAVVQLQNRDPTWDGSPLSQMAVMRRQWSAASALSNDSLAIDGRLNRIRLEVELALAPADPPSASPPVAAEPSEAPNGAAAD